MNSKSPKCGPQRAGNMATPREPGPAAKLDSHPLVKAGSVEDDDASWPIAHPVLQQLPNRARLTAVVPLTAETRAALSTREAAAHLNRQPQTLRAWACLESGPLRPVRVHGRLAWPVAELRRVLGGA